MEIGTAETILDPERRRKRRSLISGGGQGGRPGGSGGGGGDGGDNGRSGGSSHDRSREPARGQSGPQDKSKVLTWFLLLVVLMTFGGLIGAYVVIATNRAAEWRPFDLPFQVWLSTVLILVSSGVYHTAKRAFDRNEQDRARKWLLATTILGAAFISSQILLWLALVAKGYYMQGNPYAGFFYILTAAHAIHVLGGVIALGAIMLRAWHPTQNALELTYRRNLARSVGWYWHFMGVLWLVLFGLLAFWK